MRSDIEQRLRLVEQAERNLHDALGDTNSTSFKLEPFIQETLKSKKRPVEERKTAKPYLDFIKSSQRFYRGYIQELSSQFGSISELEAVARKFGSKQTSTDLQHALLQSCHRTLIHLGDLSRYRETEIDAKRKEKNWGPALGYYDLAITIYPSSGIPYNQLAIISKSEGDHARALYYLYRAQSALEPPPTALANLELELKKIHEAWERGDLAVEADAQRESPHAKLQCWFPLLHSRCFGGFDPEDYEKLESNVLQQFAVGLKERSLETNFVNRVIFSNIAADYTAGDRWQEAPDNTQNELAFKYFQRLNVQTFSILLQLLQAEYKQNSTKTKTDSPNVISPVVRRVLPGLRCSQSWLLSRAALLSAHEEEPKMQLLIHRFWTEYFNVLVLILSASSFENLPRLEYILEEDEEVVGFRPLQEGGLQQKYFDPNSASRKPKCHDAGIKRHHPNIEMQCRVRDFLEDAVELARSEFVPISFNQRTGQFVFKEAWLEPGSRQDSLDKDDHSTSTMQISPHREDLSLHDAESTTDDAASLGTSVPLSLSTTMNQMVDDLVSPERSNESLPHPSTPPMSTFASIRADGGNETNYGVGISTLTALNQVNQARSWFTSTQTQDVPNPTLPSILNSPFAPRPEEESALTRSPANQSSMPRHSPQQSQQRSPHATIESSISSMSDPTQLSFVAKGHQTRSLKDKVFGKRQHFGASIDDCNFNSSNVVTGSSFPFNARDNATQWTPPNGQG
ncbi:MAG: hypothetical protein Q9219_002334 [cf. Caloplaca sp. 3 TL-2023]